MVTLTKDGNTVRITLTTGVVVWQSVDQFMNAFTLDKSTMTVSFVSSKITKTGIPIAQININGTSGITTEADLGNAIQGLVQMDSDAGGGNTIYTGDGSLSGDRTIDLNGHSLSINGPSIEFGGINSEATLYAKFLDVPGGETISFYVQDLTADGNISAIDIASTVTTTRFEARANFNDGVKESRITGFADATTATIEYTADTHTFNGVLNLPTQAAPASPNDGDIWREDNTDTGLKIRINGLTKTITVS